MPTQNAKYRRAEPSQERTESNRILTAHSRETMSEGPESKHWNLSRDLRGVVVGTKTTMVMKREKSEIFDFAPTIKNDKITSWRTREWSETEPKTGNYREKSQRLKKIRTFSWIAERELQGILRRAKAPSYNTENESIAESHSRHS